MNKPTFGNAGSRRLGGAAGWAVVTALVVTMLAACGGPPDPLETYQAAFQNLQQVDSFQVESAYEVKIVSGEDSVVTTRKSTGWASQNATGIRAYYEEDYASNMIVEGEASLTVNQIRSYYADNLQTNSVRVPDDPGSEANIDLIRRRSATEAVSDYRLADMASLAEVTADITSQTITAEGEDWRVDFVIQASPAADGQADQDYVYHDTTISALIAPEGQIKQYTKVSSATAPGEEDGQAGEITETINWTIIQFGGVDVPEDMEPLPRPAAEGIPPLPNPRHSSRIGSQANGFYAFPEDWTVKTTDGVSDCRDVDDRVDLAFFGVDSTIADKDELNNILANQLMNLGIDPASIDAYEDDLLEKYDESILTSEQRLEDSSKVYAIGWLNGSYFYSFVWRYKTDAVYTEAANWSLLEIVLSSFNAKG